MFPNLSKLTRKESKTTKRQVSRPQLSLQRRQQTKHRDRPLQQRRLRHPQRAMYQANNKNTKGKTLPMSNPPQPLFRPNSNLQHQHQRNLPKRLYHDNTTKRPPQMRRNQSSFTEPPQQLFELRPKQILTRHNKMPHRNRRKLQHPHPLKTKHHPHRQKGRDLPTRPKRPNTKRSTKTKVDNRYTNKLRLLC